MDTNEEIDRLRGVAVRRVNESNSERKIILRYIQGSGPDQWVDCVKLLPTLKSKALNSLLNSSQIAKSGNFLRLLSPEERAKRTKSLLARIEQKPVNAVIKGSLGELLTFGESLDSFSIRVMDAYTNAYRSGNSRQDFSSTWSRIQKMRGHLLNAQNSICSAVNSLMEE